LALFSGNYNYQRDGANQALNRLVGFLEAHGAAVRIYSPISAHSAFPPTGTLIGAPSVSIPGRPDYRLSLGLTPTLRRDLESFAPTLVHLSAPDPLGAAAQRWARAKQIPCVASVHTRFETYFRYYGFGFLEPLAVAWLRAFYRRCAHLYAPSETMVSTLREQGVDGKIRLWSRGVDHTLFYPARRSLRWRRAFGIGDGETVALFVGRLVREKGLDKVAHTVRILQERGVAMRWLVVGDGPARADLERAVPSAVFTGFLTGDELATAYASADLFFNPSTTETFGNVTLEAMASGLAAVVAPATGSRSLIVHEKNGLVSLENAAADHAGAIAALAADPERRRRLGAAARSDSLTHSWHAVMASIAMHYCELLGARAPNFAPPEIQPSMAA
jgi:glycosyltransferase involved in cell wall biosynthesis